MGRSSSKPTVLDSMIKKFKKGFAGDYRVKITPRKLYNLCELHWPSFEVGRLPEGTLDLPTVQAVHQVVPRTPGHPDQFPHIDSWHLITQTLPPWARFRTTDRDRVGYLWPNPSEKRKEKGKTSIFQGYPVEGPLLPPPNIPLTPQASTKPAPGPLPDSPPPSVSPAPPHKQDSRNSRFSTSEQGWLSPAWLLHSLLPALWPY